MLLKDLPKEEMPRERLLKFGEKNLSNEELIAIILRTGTRSTSSKELASKILSKVNSLEELRNLNKNKLKDIKGLGETKIVTLIAALELGRRVYEKNIIKNKLKVRNSVDVFRYFSKYIIDDSQENLLAVFVDNHKQYISHSIMFKGSKKESVVSPQEVFKKAIEENASGVILMHNHPSGVVLPSKSDDKTTMEMANVGNIVGIPLLDHIIVGNNRYFSYIEEGKLVYE